MALHTKKQFADLCGLSTGNLSVYAGRNKVVYSGDYVDDSIEPNKTFLATRQKKALPDAGKNITDQTTTSQVSTGNPPGIKPPKKQVPKAPRVEDPEDSGGGGGETSFYQLNAKKLQSQIEKMALEMEKLRLQNSKFMGEVLPSGLIKPCILQHNQSILNQSKITLDNIIRELKKKKGFTAAEVAEIRSVYINELNDMVKKATKSTVKSLNNIIDEFAAKRSAGERT